jgi:hypoxanthine-DNA glycosylase
VSDVTSFRPVAARGARVLVLGSMPGVASLEAQQYYAHPRNAFWPIMASLLDFEPDLPYRARLAQLRRGQVALWDVLASCRRPGSLDAAIEPGSVEVNDFGAFLRRYGSISTVCCNGATAHHLFCRRALPQLAAVGRSVDVVKLPSTSPANAGTSRDQKLARWRDALAPLLASDE